MGQPASEIFKKHFVTEIMDYLRLSRTISHALRHAPQEYGLKLDSLGFVPCADLFDALAKRSSEWSCLSCDDVESAMERSSKRRFEIIGGKIRATYGHSVPGICAGELREPPEFLYHGTSKDVVDIILQEGIKPMGRNYVHLSVDPFVARVVARRHGSEIAVLKVLAREAYSHGVHFWYCNDTTWNAEFISPAFLLRE